MFDLGKEHGLSRKQVMDLIGRHGFEQPAEISLAAFTQICAELEAR